MVSMDYVFISIETTGLDPKISHIIELAATKVRDGEEIANFSTFVSCPEPVPEEVTVATGIDDETLADAPELKVALDAFFEFGRGCVLVDYTLPFSEKFLAYYATKCGLNYDAVYSEKIHVLPIVKEKLAETLKREKRLSFLPYVAEHYKIAHDWNCNGLSKAILLAKVFAKLQSNEV